MDLDHLSNHQEDVFDLLPDALVLEIFDRLQDAKSLAACMSLCKRFAALAPKTAVVSLAVSRRRTPPETTFKSFIRGAVFNPIRTFIRRMITKKPTNCSRCGKVEDGEVSFVLPNDMLQSFKEIRSLAVKLPGYDGDVSPENGSGALLKWRAEFGKELESCVILGATGFHKMDPNRYEEKSVPRNMSDNLTNKQLKKRVVWTLSCMIASSARHHMLKNIVSCNKTIRTVEISDGSRQGTIRMTERQVEELKAEMGSPAVAESECGMERTKVPAATIKIWYIPVLELPESGCVMKGATLVVVRPVVEEGRPSTAEEEDGGVVMGAFGDEEWVGEAVGKLIKKKRAYTLEMNSF